MEQTNKVKKSTAKKVIDWVVTGVFAALFICILTFQIISKQSAGSNFGVPTFNGHQTLIVLTDSMEQDYHVGSACFVEKVDCSTLKKGDDITFYYSPWAQYMDNPIVTHRIREIFVDESKAYGSGRYTFRAGGINKDSDQAEQVTGGKTRDCTDQYQDVTERYVLGKVTGNSVVVGNVYSFITSIWGLIIILLVPALYLIISYGVDLYKTVKRSETETAGGDTPNDNNGGVLSNLTDEDKKRLKEELLQELIEEKNNGKKE